MSDFKKKLLNKELTLGSWLTIPHQSVVEIMASAGFEWLTIDIEHASIDYESVLNLITVIQARGMKALVRVSKNDEVVIKRVLDAGADGIIVPMVKNAKDVQAAVDYAYLPPVGKRGVGLYRAQEYGIGFDKYKNSLHENMVIIAQIEHIESVDNIDSILANEKLDGIIIGPYDLSASMGVPGEYERDDVKNAIQKVVDSCLKSEKSLGFHVIQSKNEFILDKYKQGFNFLAFSLDFFFLGDRAREEMSKIKEQVGKQ